MNNIERYENPELIKKLKSDILKYQNSLIKKVKTSGICENLGQTEVNKLKDKYSNWAGYMDMNQRLWLIRDFSDWCMNYTGN